MGSLFFAFTLGGAFWVGAAFRMHYLFALEAQKSGETDGSLLYESGSDVGA